MTTGEKIRKIRLERGLTQKQLGELSEINEVQIRKYELDKANPKLGTIAKIAEALECGIDELMDIHIDTPIPKKRLSQTPKDVSEAEALKSLITLLDYAECDIALSTTELKRILEITKELHKALIKDFKENSDYSIIK